MASRPPTLPDYRAAGCNCSGCALACDDACAGTGLRVGLAVGWGSAAGTLARWSCSEGFSETLATRRVICSWLALTCSTAFALSLAMRSWLALSSSIPCCTVARSRAIVCSNDASSGDAKADVGDAPSCGPVPAGGVTGRGAASAVATRTPDGPGCAGSSGVASVSHETELTYGAAHRAMAGLAASP